MLQVKHYMNVTDLLFEMQEHIFSNTHIKIIASTVVDKSTSTKVCFRYMYSRLTDLLLTKLETHVSD